MDDRPTWLRDLGIFGVAVSEILGWTGVGMGLGYFGWKNWAFPVWITPVLAIIGLSIALTRIHRAARIKKP